MDEALRFFSLGVDLNGRTLNCGIAFQWLSYLYRYLIQPGGAAIAAPIKSTYSNLSSFLKYSQKSGFLHKGDSQQSNAPEGGILYGWKYPMGLELFELLEIRLRKRFLHLGIRFPALSHGFIYSDEQVGDLCLDTFD